MPDPKAGSPVAEPRKPQRGRYCAPAPWARMWTPGRPRCTARPESPPAGGCPARQTTIHCWLAPAVHAAWSRAAPLAVDARATSRHLPLRTLVKVT